MGCRSSKADQQSDSLQTAAWQKTPLVIDGSDSDWVKPLPYFDRREKLGYALSNDRDNLYIRVGTRDPQEQRKIIEGGMTVWINRKGEKEEGESLGIGFPTDSRNDREKNLMASARPDLYKNKQQSLEDLKEYALFGFDKENPVQYFPCGKGNGSGVEVSIDINRNGELVYEAKLPFAAIYPSNTNPLNSRKSIAVGIFLEGVVPRPGERRGGGGGGVSIGGGMGMGSFGSGGGLGLSIGTGSLARIGGGRSSMDKQTRIWQVVDLARH